MKFEPVADPGESVEDPLIVRGFRRRLAKQLHGPCKVAVVDKFFPWTHGCHEQQSQESGDWRQGQMPVSDESGRVPLQCSMNVNVSEGFHSRFTAPSILPEEEPWKS